MKRGYFQRASVFLTGGQWRVFIRWLLVAVGFSAASIALLYLFVEALHLPIIAATLVSAEVATLLRFFVTNRWVFDRKRATWLALWQFHCANAAAFGVWWAITNLLSHYGVYYLVAASAAIAGSSGFNFLTSFFWIWRRGGEARSAIPAKGEIRVRAGDGADIG